MDDIDSRINFACLDPTLKGIITCLKKINRITDEVIESLDKCSENTKKNILFCILLNELENIQNRTLSCAADSVLTCGQDPIGVIRTMRTDENNVLATLPSASTQSQIGRLFSTETGFSTAVDATFFVVITNPPGTGRIMYVDSVLGGSRLIPASPNVSDAAIDITVHRDAVPGSPGMIINNLNYGFPDNSAMIVTSASGGGGGAIISATTHALGYFSLDLAGKIIVPPGHSFSVEISPVGLPAQIANGISISLTVIWYELDQPT